MMFQNRHLSINDKKRLFALVAKEFTGGVINIESTVLGNRKSFREKHRVGIDASYISPIVLRDFLVGYNQDKILKYTCHVIDDENDIKCIIDECGTELYDLKAHSELIEKRFKGLVEKYGEANSRINYSKMISLIRGYLTGKNFDGKEVSWSSLNIKTNWQSKELLDWGNVNKNIIPNPGRNIAVIQKNYGYKLSERKISNLSGEPIRDMNAVVLYFKNLFHIRLDNSLKSILTYYNESQKEIKTWLNDKKLEIFFSSSEFPDNIELFTDVDKFLQAYKCIVKICVDNQNVEYGKTTNIELSFYERDGHTWFCVHHVNSRYGKSVKNSMERIGKDQNNLIQHQINGLCDLYIEADFNGVESYRINLWDENPTFECEKVENAKGVKYLMRF